MGSTPRVREPDPWWRWPAKVEPEDSKYGTIAYSGLAAAVFGLFMVLAGEGTFVRPLGIVLVVIAAGCWFGGWTAVTIRQFKRQHPRRPAKRARRRE